MKNINLPVLTTLLVILFTATSCDAIEGIFKAGFWSAIILIIVIIAIVLWIMGKTRRK